MVLDTGILSADSALKYFCISFVLSNLLPINSLKSVNFLRFFTVFFVSIAWAHKNTYATSCL